MMWRLIIYTSNTYVKVVEYNLCDLSTEWIEEHGHMRADESITSWMLFLAQLLRYLNIFCIYIYIYMNRKSN